MKFTLALLNLESIFKAVAPAKRACTGKVFTLSACAARVLVECKGNVAGLEALVFEEGAVTLAFKSFRELLDTYKGTRFLQFEADAVASHIGSLQIPILDYQPQPRPPGAFKVFPATDSAGHVSAAKRGR